ncbi:MAG: FtsX-like permease family protein, partial [Thermofilaceae archaeon]
MACKPASAFIIAVWASVIVAAAPEVLLVKVTGEKGALNSTLYLTLDEKGNRYEVSCKLSNGLCSIDGVGSSTILAVRFDGNFVALRAKGVNEAIWSGEWVTFRSSNEITYTLTGLGSFSAILNVIPASTAEGFNLEIEVGKACLLLINVNETIEGVGLSTISRWRYGLRLVEMEGYYYYPLVLPVSSSIQVPLTIDASAAVGKLLGRVSTYGIAWRDFDRGLGLTCSISCDDGNVSLAYLTIKSVREGLERHITYEENLLSKAGFDARAYTSDLEFAVELLKQSEDALKLGELGVANELLAKSLSKAGSALDTLSQIKSDSVPAFLFLLTFTFFLSSIIGQLVERRKGATSLMAFASLTVLEVALLPYARMALQFLNPDVLRAASPSTMTLSIFTAALSLAVVSMVVLSAKGTAVSDFFWYSVKSMKSRKLRSILTILTIAVVTAVASAFLAIGTNTVIREESHTSEFKGLSFSRHATIQRIIFRGMDQANEVIIEEKYTPFTEAEIKWLASLDWVEGLYTVAVGRVVVEYGGSKLFAAMVTANASDLEGVAVSEELARRLGFNKGDIIKVNGKTVPVLDVFNALSIPKLVDGVQLDEVGGYVLLGDMDLAPEGSQVYRVILVGTPPPEAAERLVRMSYVWSGNMSAVGGAQVTTYVYESYRVCSGDGSVTQCMLIVGEFQQLAGIPEFTVVVAIASLTVAVSLLGSMHERRREYSTASALGASPGMISAMVIVEGLSYGVLGGVVGYLLGEFLQVSIPAKVVQLKPHVFSPMVTSILVAVIPSLVGSLIPAREAALRVVPSRLMLRKKAEVNLMEDMAETSIPLRITGDEDLFAEYVKSLCNRPPPIGWGPIYLDVRVKKQDQHVSEIEAVVSFRSEREAIYLTRIYLPRDPGETVKAVAYSSTGEWT